MTTGTKRRPAYAYLCDACEHLSSRHLWNPDEGGDLREGPYLCLDCHCQITQDAASTSLTKREYEERKALGLPTYDS